MGIFLGYDYGGHLSSMCTLNHFMKYGSPCFPVAQKGKIFSSASIKRFWSILPDPFVHLKTDNRRAALPTAITLTKATIFGHAIVREIPFKVSYRFIVAHVASTTIIMQFLAPVASRRFQKQPVAFSKAFHIRTRNSSFVVPNGKNSIT